MTKCAAYWRAKALGKECGVPETRAALDAQNKYNDVIEELVSFGIKADDAYDLIPYSLLSKPNRSTRKLVSFISLKRSSVIRTNMLNYMFISVTQGLKVTAEGLLKASCVDRSTWSPDDYKLHYEQRAATSAIGGLTKINKMKAAHQALLKRNCMPSLSTSLMNGGYSEKIRLLSNICTSGQLAILQKIVADGHAEDEYSAFCIALKWASEHKEYVVL